MISPQPGWLFAQAAQVATAGQDAPAWAQYGAGGAAFAALGTVAVYVFKREAARGDRLEAEKAALIKEYEAEIKRLNEEIIRRHVPALEAANHATSQSVQTLQLLLERTRGGL